MGPPAPIGASARAQDARAVSPCRGGAIMSDPTTSTIHEAAESLRRRIALQPRFLTLGIGVDEEEQPCLFLWLGPGHETPPEVAEGSWAGWPLRVRSVGRLRAGPTLAAVNDWAGE